MIIINRKEIMKLLKVEGNNLRVIEQRGTLNERLTQIGYRLIEKTKEGRNNVYKIEKENEDLYIKSELKFGLGIERFKNHDNLCISIEEWDNIGIYYILKNNDIYIGSTFDGFRNRFKKHNCEANIRHMQHTYELLHNGGEFYILHDMTGIEDEVLIRQVENEYIQYAINNTDYNVINKNENSWWDTEKKIKYKRIKIEENKYEEAMQLLIDNGLIDVEENETPTGNYVLDGIIQNNFDINNMPF